MAAKSFKNNIKGADKLFSVNDAPETDTLDTQNILDTQDTRTVPDIQMQKNKAISKKKEYYRLNLKLDIELKEYVVEAAWRNKITVTDYLNHLIKADRDKPSAT